VVAHRLLPAIALVAFAACQNPTPLYPDNAPPDIVEACTLAQRKCTACHDRDRIDDAQMNEADWTDTVTRMRRFPGSNISPAEGQVILRCLLHRHATTSFLDDVGPAACAQASAL
jgi:hypothetical protein